MARRKYPISKSPGRFYALEEQTRLLNKEFPALFKNPIMNNFARSAVREYNLVNMKKLIFTSHIVFPKKG